MYSTQIVGPLDPNFIVLCPYWQHHNKSDGTRRVWQCCDSSNRDVPLLYALSLASSSSSCVEYPVQQLFLVIVGKKYLNLYGGNIKGDFAHSQAPGVPTFVTIDDQFADWFQHQFNKKVDWSSILPVQQSLQWHPESGCLWENHISNILLSKELNFKTTTHDRTSHQYTFLVELFSCFSRLMIFLLSETTKKLPEISMIELDGTCNFLLNQTPLLLRWPGHWLQRSQYWAEQGIHSDFLSQPHQTSTQITLIYWFCQHETLVQANCAITWRCYPAHVFNYCTLWRHKRSSFAWDRIRFWLLNASLEI